MKKLFWFGVAVAAVLGGVGCKHDDKVKVALLAPGASEFWGVVQAGADKAARDLNVNCETIEQAQTDAAEQKTKLEDLLSRGVKYIAIAPCDAKNQADLIDKAAQQATIITTDTDSPNSKRVCFIGSNNYDAGKKAGELLKKTLPNGGKVVVFVATLGMQNAADRVKGIEDAIKGTKIKILDKKLDNGARDKAKANVEDVIVHTPDIAALVGIFSYNGPAIAEVVAGQHKQGKIKIVCFDEEAPTLKGVRDGVIEGTVVQHPFEFGYQCVRVLAALARGEDARIPSSKVIDTGVEIVDKTNVDKFEADFKKKLGK